LIEGNACPVCEGKGWAYERRKDSSSYRCELKHRWTVSFSGDSVEDVVNHPKHYEGKKFEVIEVIEEYGLNHNKACATKYVLRAGVKHKMREVEDLNKAIWYLRREVLLIKAAENGDTPQRPKDM